MRQSARQLSRMFPLDKPYDLIPRQQVSELLRNFGDVPALTVRYPGSVGMLRFSAVGFDRKKTKAMVEVTLNSPGWSAASGFYFLDKSSSGWAISIVKHEYCITVE